jgi:hypothetical protein
MWTARLIRSGALGVPLLLLLSGCPRKREARSTPEQVLEAIVEAVRTDAGAKKVYDLLDTETRFSIMSAHKDLQRICSLVRNHYPKRLQAREVRRCDLASRAENARVWFVAYARKHRLLEHLERAQKTSTRHGSAQGNRVELQSAGQRLAFCREEEGLWTYCGLRRQFERLKVKTARDLTTVAENVEAYKGGR